MISALRWAARRLMFNVSVSVRVKVTRLCAHNYDLKQFWKEESRSGESNPRPPLTILTPYHWATPALILIDWFLVLYNAFLPHPWQIWLKQNLSILRNHKLNNKCRKHKSNMLTYRWNDNCTYIYDGKMANCCQKSRVTYLSFLYDAILPHWLTKKLGSCLSRYLFSLFLLSSSLQ